MLCCWSGAACPAGTVRRVRTPPSAKYTDNRLPAIGDQCLHPAGDPQAFGAAFTALLDAAGLTPDKVLVHLKDLRGLISRSALYDWKTGQHLPEDTGPLLDVVRLCLDTARDRGISLGQLPSDQDGWQLLLTAAKQARDSRAAQGRRAGSDRPRSALPRRPIGRWDPVRLGVHQAIGGGPLPAYVRRPHDDLLHAVLDPAPVANRLVVLRGGSSTGKTRAAYQAVVDRLPHWQVDYPHTTAALAQRLKEGIPRHTVLWLNELRHYAEAHDGPQVLAQLAELLAEHGRVVVITTLWPEHWAAYTADHHGGPGALDPARATRELLTPLPDLTEPVAVVDPASGGVIGVPERFTTDDVRRAHQRADPALETAIMAARAAGSEGEITQYLAGVPDLLNHYDGPGADPCGQAVITAAMDAARLGHNGPYPTALLQNAVIGYLTDRQRTNDLASWWGSAIKYATRGLKGTIAALEPMPPEQGTGVAGYNLADYLDQHGRRTRQTCLGPASLWDALAAHTTNSGDLDRLGEAAWDRGLYRHAVLLWKQAITTGSDSAAFKLISLLRALGHESLYDAASWVADAIAPDDAGDALLSLAALRDAGADEAFTALATRAATHATLDDPGSIARLLNALRSHGAKEAVTALLARQPAAHVTLDNPMEITQLLGALREAEAGEAFTALATRAATHATLGNAGGIAGLLGVLRWAGASEAVTALLARQPAAHVTLDNPMEITQLLGALREAGAGEAFAALATRAATHATLGVPSEIAWLDALRRPGRRGACRAGYPRCHSRHPRQSQADRPTAGRATRGWGRRGTCRAGHPRRHSRHPRQSQADRPTAGRATRGWGRRGTCRAGHPGRHPCRPRPRCHRLVAGHAARSWGRRGGNRAGYAVRHLCHPGHPLACRRADQSAARCRGRRGDHRAGHPGRRPRHPRRPWWHRRAAGRAVLGRG